MAIDLTPRWRDFAVYLPALQFQFASSVLKTARVEKTRPFPNGIKPSDFDFLNPNSKLWHYGYGLYSAGQFTSAVGKSCAVTNRDRDNTTILGDSGGYQIGKGTLKGMEAFKGLKTSAEISAKWREKSEIRKWIVNWLETHSDYAMTIDMPLWAKLPSNSKTPFHKCDIEDLIKMSVDNLEFIKHNKRDNTKWLNVLQGTTAEDSELWWNAVKNYKLSGYALAGSVGWRGGLENVLRYVMMIRDDRGFSKKQEWMHVLGVSQPIWAVLLTQIQRSIRKHCRNPNFRVSYDSASPFQLGGRYQRVVRMPKYGKRLDSWVMTAHQAPINPKYALDKNEYQFPYSSPIGDLMTLRELNWNGQFKRNVPVDALSGLMLVNHDIYVFVRGLLEANELMFMHSSEADKAVPQPLIDCCAFIEHLFTVPNWNKELEKNADLMASVFKSSPKTVKDIGDVYEEEETRY